MARLAAQGRFAEALAVLDAVTPMLDVAQTWVMARVQLEQALRFAAEGDLPHEHCTARALLARDLARAGQAGAAAELMRVALADPAIVPAGYPPARV